MLALGQFNPISRRLNRSGTELGPLTPLPAFQRRTANGPICSDRWVLIELSGGGGRGSVWFALGGPRYARPLWNNRRLGRGSNCSSSSAGLPKEQRQVYNPVRRRGSSSSSDSPVIGSKSLLLPQILSDGCNCQRLKFLWGCCSPSKLVRAMRDDLANLRTGSRALYARRLKKGRRLCLGRWGLCAAAHLNSAQTLLWAYRWPSNGPSFGRCLAVCLAGTEDERKMFACGHFVRNETANIAQRLSLLGARRICQLGAQNGAANLNFAAPTSTGRSVGPVGPQKQSGLLLLPPAGPRPPLGGSKSNASNVKISPCE